MKVLPPVAQDTNACKSAVLEHLAGSTGYDISRQKRKLIEQGFGWGKFIGVLRQVMLRGLKKGVQLVVLTISAYNLLRVPGPDLMTNISAAC
jgi:hypothetical protein